jgi:hypothetical protein
LIQFWAAWPAVTRKDVSKRKLLVVP